MIEGLLYSHVSTERLCTDIVFEEEDINLLARNWKRRIVDVRGYSLPWSDLKVLNR